jgi:hypothetical protein
MTVEASTHLPYAAYVKSDPYLTSSHALLQRPQEVSHGLPNMWDVYGDADHELLTDMQCFSTTTSSRHLYQLDLQAHEQAIANPSLPKSIFDVTSDINTYTMSTIDTEMLPWDTTALQAPTETIEPGLAFRNTIPSSPDCKNEPSTPIKGQLQSSLFLSSSPMSTVSPKIVLSQHDFNNVSYDLLYSALSDTKKHVLGTERFQRCSYERKRIGGHQSRPKTSPKKTGYSCEPIIHVNAYPCSVAGCINKEGKPKAFKRQEHKKRHEKTVHNINDEEKVYCWVPKCNRGFTRADNLNSHLKNTHCRRSGGRGNRYVATLDKNSTFYDPDWRGDIDDNGYPASA